MADNNEDYHHTPDRSEWRRWRSAYTPTSYLPAADDTGGWAAGRKRSVTMGIAKLGLERADADVDAAVSFGAFAICPECGDDAAPEAQRSVGPTRVRMTCPACEIATDWVVP